jgi:intracellular septation protein A
MNNLIFVNYLNNLWSNSKPFTRTSNTILLTIISNKYLQKFKKIIIEKYNFIKNISNFN